MYRHSGVLFCGVQDAKQLRYGQNSHLPGRAIHRIEPVISVAVSWLILRLELQKIYILNLVIFQFANLRKSRKRDGQALKCS